MDNIKFDFSFLDDEEEKKRQSPTIRRGRLDEPKTKQSESSFTFDASKLDFSPLRMNEDGSPKETISPLNTKEYEDTLKGKYEQWYDEKYVPFSESDFAKGFQDKFEFMQSPTIQKEPISKVRGGTSVDRTAVNYLNKTKEGRDFLKEGHSDEELLNKANELREKSLSLTEDTSFNIGQAVGSMGKFAGLYAMGGGTVEKAVSPMFEKIGLSAGASVASAVPTGAVGSNLTTTGLNTLGNFLAKAAPVLATEYSKDVLLGQPIHYIDAKARGLEGEELVKYMGKENLIDVAANGLFYGFGRAVSGLKGSLDSQLAKLKELDFDKKVGEVSDLVTQMSKETGIPEKEVNTTLIELYDTRIKPFNDYKMGDKTLKLLENKETHKRVSDAMVDMDIRKATQVKENLEETWNEVAELIQMKYGTAELTGSQVDNLKNEIGIDVANLAERLVKADEHLEVLMRHKADPNMVMNTDSIIKRMKYGLVDDEVDNALRIGYANNIKEMQKLDNPDDMLRYIEDMKKNKMVEPEPGAPKVPDVEEKVPTTPKEVGYKAPEPETKRVKEIVDDISEPEVTTRVPDIGETEQVVKSVDKNGNPILEELEKAQADKGTTKTSKFTKTAKGYAALSEEVTTIINKVDYKSLKNSEIRAIASRLADKYPNEALTIIRDVKTSFRNDLEAATALEYVVKMQDEAPELAGQLIEDISRKFTVSGKVVQIASMWARITKKGLDGFMSSLEKRYDYSIPDSLKNEAISQWEVIEATMDNPQLRDMLITNYLSATKKLFSGRTLQDIAARDGVDIDRLIASVPDKIKAMVLNQDPKEMETWLGRFMRDKSTKQLQEANRQVLLGRIRDTIPKATGRQLSTVQAFSHLLNIKTFLRNIISNTTFNAMEDVSNILAWGADYAMHGMGYSPVRSVALPTLNLGTQGKRFMEGLRESSANIRLGIKSGSAGKYTLGNYGSSFSSETFGGRVGQSLERLLSYELQATDEAYKNVVRGNILDQLKKLSDDGVITDDMRNIAEQEALYRTFQDDSLPAHILNQVGDLLNTIPLAPRRITGTTGRMIGNREVLSFGLKDLTVKYTKVPGNIIARAIEYSPIGSFKAISLLSKINSGQIPIDQNTLRQLNMTLGRVATGSGMLAFGKWLADKGVLFTQDPSNTPTKSAFEKAQGLGNTQLNISAIDRFLEGAVGATRKDYELGERVNGFENLTDLLSTKKGDKLLTINNLAEPFSKPLALGATVSKIQDGKGNYLEDVQQLVNSTWEEIVDLPTMSVIKSMTYQDGFLQAAAVPIVQAVPGFIPSVIRHAANYQVPEQREAYSGNMAEQFKRQVMQNIPGLRDKVPERLSPIGTTYGGTGGDNRLMDLANAAISPGRTDIYQPVNYDDILQNVAKELDTTDHYPSKSAPKTMTINGIERELDDEQKEYFQKTYGQLIDTLYSEVAGDIRDASVQEQHAVLTSLKRRARAYAREKTTERYFMGTELPGL